MIGEVIVFSCYTVETIHRLFPLLKSMNIKTSVLPWTLAHGMGVLAVSVLLAACTSSAPVASNPRIPERSANSSNMVQKDGPVNAVELSTPSVSLDNSPMLGSDTAKIGIVEFSDYECPYCRTSQTQLLPQVKKEYIDTGVVRYVHKDYPLVSIHTQAAPAAIAAQCAHAQGRFWDMHQALFANRLRDALYPELARQLKLDEQNFSACLKDAAPREAIYRDVQEARRLGISGTPSFIVGRIEGNKLTVTGVSRGMPSFEAIIQQVEALRK